MSNVVPNYPNMIPSEPQYPSLAAHAPPLTSDTKAILAALATLTKLQAETNKKLGELLGRNY